jgi:multiple sugar transport system permease protein
VLKEFKKQRRVKLKLVLGTKLKSKIKNASSVALFLLPYIVAFTIFFIVPFIYGIVISLHKWDVINPSKSVFVGFDNYYTLLFKEGFRQKEFLNALKNTAFFVLISCPLLVIVPLFISLLLDIEPKFYKVFRAIFFLPTILSVAVVCLIFKWQFDTTNGSINGILKFFGAEPIAWLNQQPYAWIVILVTTIWWTIGTNTVIFGAGLKEVDRQLYEAGEIDGANYFQSLWHISIPGIKNQIFLCLFTSIIASFNLFGQPSILTGGGPGSGSSSSTASVIMIIKDAASNQRGLASAAAIILGLIIMVVGVGQFIFNKKASKA